MTALGPQLLFAATIFSSAFLLFLVQPIVAKQILPWFGGAAGVWAVCMVFFQLLLLAGYAYADALVRRVGARMQAVVHGTLLVVSLATLPIVASERWKPVEASEPTLAILGLLAATIGLPYFLLSTTGPLLQAWLARAPWGLRVYRYFSLSNLASLLALLAYPVALEPWALLRWQAIGWSAGYAGFVLLGLGATVIALRLKPRLATAPAAPAAAAAPGWRTHALWLALPALGSWLLLAVTNHITQHVASIPFLWILPLAVYLASFILCFESDRWYRRALWLPLAGAALLLGGIGLVHSVGTEVKTAVPLYLGALFVLCMTLHGETARLRPAMQHLTRFYLLLSVGGAAGGVAVGLIAPFVLDGYYELGLGLVATAALGSVVLRGLRGGVPASVAAALACAALLAWQIVDDQQGARRISRNFYGTLATYDRDADSPREGVRELHHGSVKHGEQYLDPARRREPTAYYGATSGIGRVLAALPPRPARVGIVGLGAGTLAAYARPGDTYRLYEIDPQVFELARAEFSFLADSAATLHDVPGDARLSLEREPPQHYDVLAIDAFSGGAIPVHLLTLEALDLYLRHLAPDGVLAFHVTNRHLDLPPVLLAAAQARGLAARLVHDDARDSELRATDWVLMSRDAARLPGAPPQPETPAAARAWTDDRNDLLGVLR